MCYPFPVNMGWRVTDRDCNFYQENTLDGKGFSKYGTGKLELSTYFHEILIIYLFYLLILLMDFF